MSNLKFNTLCCMVLLLFSCQNNDKSSKTTQIDSPKQALSSVVKTRQQIQEFALIDSTNDQFINAEQLYKEALKDADAGDFNASFAHATSAVTVYKSLVKQALEDGPYNQLMKKYEAIKSKLPKHQRQIADKKVKDINQRLSNNNSDHIDVGNYTAFVLEGIFELDEFLGSDLVFDTSCLPPTQPVFSDIIVTEATPGSLLRRQAINYVSGKELDVSLTLPRCTGIGDIFVNTSGHEHQLSKEASSYDQIEGTIFHPFHYTILESGIQDDQVAIKLRLHFPNHKDGRTLVFRLEAKSSRGTLTTDQNITVVTVHKINDSQYFSISENQISNDMITAIYQDFGDGGRMVQDPVDLIDPFYHTFIINASDTGLYYSQAVKADIPACDIKISSNGRFVFVIDDGQIDIVWIDGPNVRSSFPILCELTGLLLIPLRVGFSIVFNHYAEKCIKNRIQNRINRLVTSFINTPGGSTLNPLNFVESITTLDNEILVTYNTPGDRVSIEVPYQSNNLEESAFEHGMAFNRGEQILVSASGLTNICTLEGNPTQDCNPKKVGPGGLFNWNNDTPTPTPWPCFSNLGPCAYFKQRHEARKRLLGLRRDSNKLPLPQRNVGAFMGRLASSNSNQDYILIDDITTIDIPPFRDSRVAFGNNDFRYVGTSEQGSGKLNVSINWPLFPIAGLAPPTPSDFSLPNLLKDAGLLKQIK